MARFCVLSITVAQISIGTHGFATCGLIATFVIAGGKFGNTANAHAGNDL